MDHLRYSGLSQAIQLKAARDILSANRGVMRRLEVLAETGLPDGWLVSGALYGNIWNSLTGRPDDYGVKDYDVFYFDDTDLSYAAEDAVIQRLTPLFPPEPPVEIRNQARVHLWYEDHFGSAYTPLADSHEGIRRFACTTHMIGARLSGGELEIYTPCGLEPIFGFRLIGNTDTNNRVTHEAKAARHVKFWPELEFVPWPGDLTPYRAGNETDWAGVQRLLAKSFAYMEPILGRPAGATQATAEALAEEAQQGACWLIGTPYPVACLFTRASRDHPDALYLGKLAVEETCRGQGLARQLVERAASQARTQGLAALTLDTGASLTQLQATFGRLGFETPQERDGEPGVVTMMRPL
ncbi:hypothetical protein AIOL_000701 [Candidatus Rhodobacter oscarellae]|uniref:N-acetyltransferase domain-containing protein n=1 Tax=Candidatus Rhodobacter oscarellae TaxID=1675527 RepID=A0A0J9EFS9_9RHOB|nr:nucleotidyltransferase family protein [Candidatus Rhodobacter lobularis]KMW60539.1 hypothetical protein AIOL_000701 [Candidatus Rhodobacter lobularis]